MSLIKLLKREKIVNKNYMALIDSFYIITQFIYIIQPL